MSPVPMSVVSQSRLNPAEVGIDGEKVAVSLFKKRLSRLEPHEFIRSFVFELSLESYLIRGGLFKNPIQISLKYNSIDKLSEMDNV